MRIPVFTMVLFAVACTPSATAATPATVHLTPYTTITPWPSPSTPAGLVVDARTPLPSPTPSQYTIGQGDTLSQIAERFRISLDSLLAANPQVNPNALRVGEVLQVPASPVDFAGEGTPTPAPFPVKQVSCHPTATGALWCFVTVSNESRDLIENITAQVTLVDPAGDALESKTAVLPLDILPAGATLPLSVLFSPPLPLDVMPQARILTAIQISPEDRRYLDAEARNTTSEISWSGRSANVKGEVLVAPGAADAATIWLVVVAYDRSGQVVGWRRWEHTSGVAAGASVSFQLTVSSVAGRIESLDFIAQARP